ncbi:hypothetical protein DPMN_037020 [Dreissena polymorpha]|uniref:Sulfotransferase domain-containing protein n=2 Tax=Dreissena polymorpha TaxID=45954 RepID=A0A9D4RPE7_DREPO|nr:hypothetical protein DPMN_037020 [Dreissena polymorpha]
MWISFENSVLRLIPILKPPRRMVTIATVSSTRSNHSTTKTFVNVQSSTFSNINSNSTKHKVLYTLAHINLKTSNSNSNHTKLRINCPRDHVIYTDEETWLKGLPRVNDSHNQRLLERLTEANISGTNAVFRSVGNLTCRQRMPRDLRLTPCDLPVTALASPFRCGNTWLRHLVQQATGYGTSSIYCDQELKTKGFPFECERSQQKKTLLVKTHQPEPSDLNEAGKVSMVQLKRRFAKAVYLIRNPYEFIVANHHRFHLDNVPEDQFLGQAGSRWRAKHPSLLKWWQAMNQFWLHDFSGPVFPVVYSNLLHKTETELRGLLEFLRVNVSKTDIRCAVINGEGNFHRQPRKWTQIRSILQLFDVPMQQNINSSFLELKRHLKEKYNIDWHME